MKRDEILGSSLVQRGLVVYEDETEQNEHDDQPQQPIPPSGWGRLLRTAAYLLFDVVYAAVLIVVILGILYFSGEQSVFIYMRF